MLPVDLLMDNMSIVKLIKNPEYHHRTKHINVKYKFSRRHFEEELLNVSFVPTESQLAGFLKESLSQSEF